MTTSVPRGALVSDFNLETLAAYLRNDDNQPSVETAVAPYGQVAQALLDASLPLWGPPLDFVLVWTRPESVLESFARLLAGSPTSQKELESDVDAFCATLAAAHSRARVMLVPTWVVPTFHVGHGLLDLAPEIGVARALLQANLRLLENLDQIPNAIPLHAAKWVEVAGAKAFNPRLWYLGKVPFGNDLLKAAARDVKSGLRGISGRARKLLILDLDEVLWGGILGDEGWPNLVLGGHHPAGEALVDFQRELKALTRRGVVLAIASKNDEALALEAIAQHPAMVLRPDDFAAWRINWRDKAANVVELAEALNLGLEAAVFIDDSEVERARVREALPQVLVPEWPADKRLYPHALRSLDCFDQPALTEADRRRSSMYAVERQREALKAQVGSLEEWLHTLNISVTVEPAHPANLARVTQLLNKTNQMNLRARRMTEGEFLAWASLPGHRAWAFSVADKFGDAGLTGILSLETEGPRATVVDFVVSCRVMGRNIERAMLHVAVDWARAAHLQEVHAPFVPTPRNAPCHEFLQSSGLRCQDGHTFVWDADREYPLPPAVRLVSGARGAGS
jgi:FkbH-like protein